MAQPVDQKKILELAAAVGTSFKARDDSGKGISITFSPDGTCTVGQYLASKYLFVATTKADYKSKPQEGVDLNYVAEKLEDLINPKPSTANPAAIDNIS